MSTQNLPDQLGIPALEAALEVWASRDDSKAQAEVRAAANDAIDAVDSAIARLHKMRSQLVGEIRVSDDIAMRRTEALVRAQDGAA